MVLCIHDPVSTSDTPKKFLETVQEVDLDPRDFHWKQDIAESVIQDLLKVNPKLREDASRGEVVYKYNYRFDENRPGAHADLVLGEREYRVDINSGKNVYNIAEDDPHDVWLVLEIDNMPIQGHRGIMYRRMNDWNSTCMEARYLEDEVVTGGIAMFIKDEERESPEEHDFQTELQQSVDRISENIFDIPSSVKEASFDTWGAVVLEEAREGNTLITDEPAPQETERVHYENFITEISGNIDEKFYDLPEPHTADVDRYLDGVEGRTVEFKQEVPDTARNLAKDGVAFANTDGGLIVVGVDDSGRLSTLDDPVAEVRSEVNDILQGHTDGMDYEISVETVRGEDVVTVRVPKASEKLHEVHGAFYTRRGQQSVAMSYADLERFFKRKFVDDHNLADLVK